MPVRNQQGFVLSPSAGVPTNDPMIPEAQAYADALRQLDSNYNNAIKTGSFTAQHPVLSPLLRALGGAALGSIAGPAGAAVGASVIGMRAGSEERDRKAMLAAAYQQQAKNILDNQQTFNSIKKDRTAGQFAGNLFEANGMDPSIFLDPNGVALQGLDVGLLGKLMEGQQGINDVNAIGPMFSQAQQAGINTGNQVMNSPVRPQLPSIVTTGMKSYIQGKNGQMEKNNSQPMPLPAFQSEGPNTVPLQGSVQGSPLQPISFGYTPSMAAALASGATRIQDNAAKLPISAFEAQSQDVVNQANASQAPSKIALNQANANQSNAAASVAPSQSAANNARANYLNSGGGRSGGSGPNNYGKISAEDQQSLALIKASTAKNAPQWLVDAGQQEYARLTNKSLVTPPAAPKGPNLVESLLNMLGPKKAAPRYATAKGS